MSMTSNLATQLSNIIQVDQQALDALQSITVGRIPKSRYDAKTFSMSDDFEKILAQRSMLCEQDDWHGAMAMVWPNTPPDQRPFVTVFSNENVLTTVLAIRAGIDVSAAIELTFTDKIEAVSIGSLSRNPLAFEGHSLCGIFRVNGAGDLFKFALFAAPGAMCHRPIYAPDELIFFHQEDENELFWGRDFHTQSRVFDMWESCPDEAIWFGPSLIARKS